MKHYIDFGSERIEYSLFYVDRKSLGITVTPDMEVLVKSPIDASLEKVAAIIKKKAPWILKQKRAFLAYYPKMPVRRYVGGETHLYLGRQYRLLLHKEILPSVSLKGKFINIYCEKPEKASQLLTDWYLTHAVQKFHEIAKPLIERFNKYNVSPSSVVIRQMPTRWGSCTPNGKIILNPELIKAPKGCIEYVITHELCHLIYHDHTQKFLDLQSKEMPDWEKWKKKLELLLA
ncbi:M48 family metallopeptidase [Mucilaginibacter antarcticus]|uniref:M48 family metallopeptidase n=1 Tax=Mucilaginibacter antarcticus TaxID=1855725 RepID=A0ABW5XLC1_9SPHI